MGFSITDMLNKDTSMAAAPVKDHTIERISYSKLVPSEDNFYSMQEIEELKTVCWCGRGARCNARIDADGNMVSSGEQVELGANERYISLCRKHFTERKTGPV